MENLVSLGGDGHLDVGLLLGAVGALGELLELRAQHSVGPHVGGCSGCRGRSGSGALLQHGLVDHRAVGRDAQLRYLGLVAVADAYLALVGHDALLVRIVGQVVVEGVLFANKVHVALDLLVEQEHGALGADGRGGDRVRVLAEVELAVAQMVALQLVEIGHLALVVVRDARRRRRRRRRSCCGGRLCGWLLGVTVGQLACVGRCCCCCCWLWCWLGLVVS